MAYKTPSITQASAQELRAYAEAEHADELGIIDQMYSAYAEMNNGITDHVKAMTPEEQTSWLMVLNPLEGKPKKEQKRIWPVEYIAAYYRDTSSAIFERMLKTEGSMPVLLDAIKVLKDPDLATELYTRLSHTPDYYKGYVAWLKQDYEEAHRYTTHYGEIGYTNTTLWNTHKRAEEVCGPYNSQRGLGLVAVHKMQKQIMKPLIPIFQRNQPVATQCVMAALK